MSLAVFTCFVLLILLLIVGTSIGGLEALTAPAATNTEERLEFLHSCGWEADPDSETAQQIQIPERFTTVYENYNQLQLQQGYDLAKYAGESCTLYSYTVLNYPDSDQTVIADIYVYKGRIIGGDVHSTNLNGFMIAVK